MSCTVNNVNIWMFLLFMHTMQIMPMQIMHIFVADILSL